MKNVFVIDQKLVIFSRITVFLQPKLSLNKVDYVIRIRSAFSLSYGTFHPFVSPPLYS